MKIRMAGILDDVLKESVVDGEGVRLVMFLQGCPHHCASCHNPTSWLLDGGMEYDVYNVVIEVSERYSRYLSGVTISGGDPFAQPEALLELTKDLRKVGIDNIWIYTGFTIEKLLEDEINKEIFKNIDCLVDGLFIENLKDSTLKFRGSSNQRIIKFSNGEHTVEE